jgi:streptogramin lyase
MLQPARVGSRLAAAVLGVLASAGLGYAQPNPYHRVTDWAQLPPDFQWAQVSGIAVDAQDNLWVEHRSDPPIVKLDKSRRLVKSLGQGLLAGPHGLHLDRNGNLWVVDSGALRATPGSTQSKGYQVLKLNQDGKVLLTLGKAGVSKDGPDTFIAPTGVVTNAKGEIFVTDGHGQQENARIVKFAKDGQFLKEWGHKGSKPGELSGPHAIAMDSQGRLFVADRWNNRVQIFDQEGNYLDQWMHFSKPSGIWIDKNDTLYVADAGDADKTHPGWGVGVRIGSAKDGSLTGYIPNTDPESVATDAEGNVYGGIAASRVVPSADRLQKYVKKK